MNLVQMRCKGECGPACLAMVLGIDLDVAVAEVEALARHKVTEYGTGDRHIIQILERHGYAAKVITEWDSSPAIVTVPSLNHLGLLHFVVWDGEQWLDPVATGLRYPQDAPVVMGEQQVQWASAITFKRRGDTVGDLSPEDCRHA